MTRRGQTSEDRGLGFAMEILECWHGQVLSRPGAFYSRTANIRQFLWNSGIEEL